MAKLKGQLFARLALDYFDHPKIAALSAEAIVAHLEMIVYARKYLTDGDIPMRVAMRYASDVLDELASNDPERPSIVRNDDGSVTIYGYGDLQETRADVDDRRRSAKERAEARWKKDAPSNAHSTATSNARSNAGSNAETETETETEINPIGRTAPQRPAPKRATQLSDSWTPSDAHRQQASEKGIDVALEAAKMRDWAISKGESRKDWDATFRNWIRNARPTPGHTPKPTAGQRLLEEWELRG